MWYLSICFPNGETHEFDLSRGEVIIGRASDCGLVLDDISISRYHAKISIGNIGVIIEDMQSSNGVLVNGHVVVDKVVLRAGDEILLGNVKLNLLAGEDEERTMLFQPQPEESAEASLMPETPLQQSDPKPYKLPTEATDVVETSKLMPSKEASPGKRPIPEVQESTKITTLAELEGSFGEDGTEEFTPKLLIFAEGAPQKKYPLYREHINIGRAEDNDIIIDHGSISRFHAKLMVCDGSYTLIDLGSANGTMVNGISITRVALKNWDEIYFGSVRAKFAGKPQAVPQPSQTLGKKAGQEKQKPRYLMLLFMVLVLLIVLLGYMWLSKIAL